MSVIKTLKEIFTTVGIPRCIVSDGGTQFTSQEFKNFIKDWQIDHRITSPTNAQSNGQAERFVQTKEQSHQSNGRRGRLTFSNSIIHNNTPESQSTITSRVIEL